MTTTMTTTIGDLNEAKITRKHNGTGALRRFALLTWDDGTVTRITTVPHDAKLSDPAPDSMGEALYDGKGRQLVREFGLRVQNVY